MRQGEWSSKVVLAITKLTVRMRASTITSVALPLEKSGGIGLPLAHGFQKEKSMARVYFIVDL
jgi:hypothetical protein